jgi:8-oxo-dGTP pyrophosphatase MutT (NUDIX family)
LETDQDTDVTVRREIMNQLPDSNITTNQKYYTPDFVKNAKIKNIAKEQEILSGKGYDRHIVDTAIRETLEEAGIELNKDEMKSTGFNNK